MTAAATIETASGKHRGTENFPVGSWLIRPDLRAHVHAFYNFARAADDVSDNPLLETSEKIARLDRFAEVLRGAGGNDVPSAIAMRESLKATGITPQHCLDLLKAFKRDATQLRYKDWPDLMDYCRYSAMPVGRHVLELHDIGRHAWPANDELCAALQVINHIQDCAEDYGALDRVYIPQNLLAATGGRVEDLASKVSTPGLRKTFDLMLDQLDRMMLDACDLPSRVSDARLKCETSVICMLAKNLIRILRRRDPLADDVKLGKISVIGATIFGVARAWL